MTEAEWVDLVDPDEAELRERTPMALHARALDRLLRPTEHTDYPRPTLESHGDYVFGVFLVAVAVLIVHPDLPAHAICNRCALFHSAQVRNVLNTDWSAAY